MQRWPADSMVWVIGPFSTALPSTVGKRREVEVRCPPVMARRERPLQPEELVERRVRGAIAERPIGAAAAVGPRGAQRLLIGLGDRKGEGDHRGAREEPRATHVDGGGAQRRKLYLSQKEPRTHDDGVPRLGGPAVRPGPGTRG